MVPAVHILVTCRNPELWRASTLVFDSIRTGFPTAQIYVEGNDLSEDHCWEIAALCDQKNAVFKNDLRTVHYQWIGEIIEFESEPFVICDTDVVFHDSVEEFFSQGIPGALMGRHIPQFRCPLTGSITYERLHTALMRIDPRKFRESRDEFLATLNPKNPFWTGIDVVAPEHYIIGGKTYLHDTLGKAFHAFGGVWLGDNILDCFDHLNAGTYSDLLDEKVPGFRARQEKILKDPRLAKGIWKEQQNWYEHNAA